MRRAEKDNNPIIFLLWKNLFRKNVRCLLLQVFRRKSFVIELVSLSKIRALFEDIRIQSIFLCIQKSMITNRRFVRKESCLFSSGTASSRVSDIFLHILHPQQTLWLQQRYQYKDTLLLQEPKPKTPLHNSRQFVLKTNQLNEVCSQ